MKQCSICKEEKEISAFNTNKARKDGLQTACKECCKSQAKNWYSNNKKQHIQDVKKRKDVAKQKLFEYLQDKKCAHCPENDPIVLEFDHIDRTEKEHQIGTMVLKNYSWNTILEEIKKCQILCANCHRKKTAKEDGHYKYRMQNS